MEKFVFKQRIFILATLRQKVWHNLMNEIPAKIALHARGAGALLGDDDVDDESNTMVMCCLLQIIIMFVMSFLIGLEVVHTIIILLLDLFDI